jgi:hypothetical protein
VPSARSDGGSSGGAGGGNKRRTGGGGGGNNSGGSGSSSGGGLLASAVNAVAWRLPFATPAALLHLADAVACGSHTDHVFAEELTRGLYGVLHRLSTPQLLHLLRLAAPPDPDSSRSGVGVLKAPSRPSLVKGLGKQLVGAMHELSPGEVRV